MAINNTPIIPNSLPPNGRNDNTLAKPKKVKLVKRKDPHAAHPTPNSPLKKPRNPVASSLSPTSFILRLRKYVNIEIYTPNKTAIKTV